MRFYSNSLQTILHDEIVTETAQTPLSRADENAMQRDRSTRRTFAVAVNENFRHSLGRNTESTTYHLHQLYRRISGERGQTAARQQTERRPE